MKFLKLNITTQQDVFDHLQGYQKGNHIIQLRKDIDDNYFIHSDIKDSPIFQDCLTYFNQLEEVSSVQVFEEDIDTGEQIIRTLQ